MKLVQFHLMQCKKLQCQINLLISQAMLGPLPAGFLRLNTEREIQESADRQAAIALYQQQNASYVV